MLLQWINLRTPISASPEASIAVMDRIVPLPLGRNRLMTVALPERASSKLLSFDGHTLTPHGSIHDGRER
jgi:hypothetical protein